MIRILNMNIAKTFGGIGYKEQLEQRGQMEFWSSILSKAVNAASN